MLHLTSGDALVPLLRDAQAAKLVADGDILPWRDVLHEGPVPDVADVELRAVRAAFLAGQGLGDRTTIEQGFADRDARLAEALATGEGIVLWFDGDLVDRLQLGQIAARLAAHEASAMLVEVDERIHGTPAALWPTRRRLPPMLAATLVGEWEALRDGRLDAVPRRLREELPWTTDGLTLSERLILLVTDAGAGTPHEIFAGQAALEERAFLGDTWVWERIARLGPLLDLADDDEGAAGLVGRLTVSPAGRAVLAGDADAVELLGIDRWLGGAQLTAAAHLRWDPAAAQVVRYPLPR